jgi:hypothetical protein
MSDLSSFLFARPSFLEGVARLLDFGNTLTEYNQSLTAERADSSAFWCDWRAIGEDYAAILKKCRGRGQESPSQ